MGNNSHRQRQGEGWEEVSQVDGLSNANIPIVLQCKILDTSFSAPSFLSFLTNTSSPSRNGANSELVEQLCAGVIKWSKAVSPKLMLSSTSDKAEY